MKTNPKDSIYQHKEEIDVRGMPLTHMTKGLTKIEYFAAMAMSSILANQVQITPEKAAEQSFNCAMALIIKINKAYGE